MSLKGMDSIEIVSVSRGFVVFDVLHTAASPSYRMTGSAQSVRANLSGNTAEFEFEDERGGVCRGSIEFLDERLVVEIKTIGTYGESSGPGGSADMYCVMLRDKYQGTRKVDESELLTPEQRADYLFPGSDKRYLQDGDVRFSSPRDLRFGRNEIFARHGLIFESRDLDEYFRSKSWYSPTVSSADMAMIELNRFEEQNTRVFQSVEREWKSLSNGGPFIGVKGIYNRASDPSELAVINVTSISSRSVTIDILSGSDEKVYFKGLTGPIVGEDEATFTLGSSGATVTLHWLNPGTMEIRKTSGVLPANLRNLVDPPEYWNSRYLRTS